MSEPLSHRDVPQLRLARRSVRAALAHMRSARVRYGSLPCAAEVERLHAALRREDARLTALIGELRTA